MKIKASGRLALMVAAGFFVCLAGPLPAHAAGADTSADKTDSAAPDKTVRQSSRQAKRSAQHSSSGTAAKSATKKAAAGDAGSVTSTGIPASVANANAELTSGDNATAMPAQANGVLAAADKPADDGSVVASDQLNDVDRALQREQPAEPQQQAQQQTTQPQMAQQETPPVQPQAAAAAPPKQAPVLASSESSSLDQTSLIGKIFIGFGALLTVASAARMFMA
ncbi:hypothetical protein H8A99_25515 [Bradyrhizobium sp. Arg68]|uniref:hypothetical protein n=1 Tax=Bradyrhizobium ivorense TaxID=2511166 RepID=UPI001E424163|nr:hypothetical protein [Bradyrhizobium ivorense]MCC8939734.1 hypothetical protein [Bradyrhizobium ivorense]